MLIRTALKRLREQCRDAHRVALFWILVSFGASAWAGARSEVFVQLGHRSAITAVAFGPDGHLVVSASLDGMVKLWELKGGREIRTLVGHQGSVLAVAFAPDGRTLASAGRDRTVRLWDATSGSLIRTLAGHENIVLSVAYTRDGRLISSGYDGSVRVWDVTKGVELGGIKPQGVPVRTLALSPDGKTLALALEDGAVRLIGYPAGNEIVSLRGHRGAVQAVSFSPSGQLASAGQDGLVRTWDVGSGRELSQLAGHVGPVMSVAYSASGQWIASGGQDGTLRVWHAPSGQLAQRLRTDRMPGGGGPGGEIAALAFAPKDDTLLSGGQDRAVHVWNAATGTPTSVLRTRAGDVRAIAYSHNGKTAAIASADGRVRVWDAINGKVLRTLGGPHGIVEALVFSSDGLTLASAGQDKRVRLWEWSKGTLTRELAGHQGAVHALAFSPDGQQLASAGFDTRIRLWDAASGATLRELVGHTKSVRSLAFSPDGRLLASGSYDDTARLWSVASGAPVRTFNDHANRVTSVAFTPDGLALVSGSEDSTVRLRPVLGEAVARVFAGHTGPVRAVAVSADGKTIASASVDGTLARWDVATGKPLGSLALGAGQLFALAYGSAAGGSFTAGGDGGAAVVVSAVQGTERARLFGFVEGDWVSITPEGFFSASDGGERYLSVRLGNEVHGLEQFSETFFRPDAVRLALTGTLPERAVAANQEQIQEQEQEQIKRRNALAQLERDRLESERLAQAQIESAKLEEARRRIELARLESERLAQSEARRQQDEARRREELARLEQERIQAERLDREQAERATAEALRRQEELARLNAERPKPSRLAQILPAPKVEILGLPSEVTTEEISLTLRIADAGGGIGDVRLYLNDTAVLADSTRNLAVVKANEATPEPGTFRYKVRLVRGRNSLRAVAFNAGNTMQSADAVQEIVANFQLARRASLHAIVVGVQEFRNRDLTLQYSIADGKLFAQVLSERAKGLFETVNVRTLLTPAETTREAIAAALKAVRARVNPEDLFVFYVASHGTVDAGEYFLISSNVGSISTTGLKANALSQTELKELVANIPATKKLIVLDTCNAGQMGEALQVAFLTRGMSQGDAIKLLSRAVGSTVLSASSSQQEAIEGYKGHGLFTWVIVEGLRGAADANKDGTVRTTELTDYVDATVPSLAEQVFKREQFPIASSNGMQFSIVQVPK